MFLDYNRQHARKEVGGDNWVAIQRLCEAWWGDMSAEEQMPYRELSVGRELQGVTRPANAITLYKRDTRERAIVEVGDGNDAINKRIRFWWNELPKEERLRYYRKAYEEEERFRQEIQETIVATKRQQVCMCQTARFEAHTPSKLLEREDCCVMK